MDQVNAATRAATGLGQPTAVPTAKVKSALVVGLKLVPGERQQASRRKASRRPITIRKVDRD